MKTQFDLPVTLKIWWVSGNCRNFYNVIGIERRGGDMILETERATILVNWSNATVLEEIWEGQNNEAKG